jgi:hypothetical protein
MTSGAGGLRLAALSCVFIVAASQAARADDALAPCQRLASVAMSMDKAAWSKPPEEVLKPELAIPPRPTLGAAYETRVSELPAVQHALSIDPEAPQIETVDRVPGSDVFAVYTIGGTAKCQVTAFVSAPAITSAKMLPMPDGARGDLCWTVQGDAGRLFGQPSWFEHGDLSDHTLDWALSAFPLVDEVWRPGCRMTLRFRPRFIAEMLHCTEAAICSEARSVAPRLAEAYYRYRQASDGNRDDPGFRFAEDAPADAEAAAIRAMAHPPDELLAGERFLPLKLAGRWYVATIGYDGIGWRESGPALIGIYAEEQGEFVQKAGFQVPTSENGLERVDVEALCNAHPKCLSN